MHPSPFAPLPDPRLHPLFDPPEAPKSQFNLAGLVDEANFGDLQKGSAERGFPDLF